MQQSLEQCSYVLFLDLDGFKAVNDVFGHSAGDELLCTVANRLTQSVRPIDFLGRMGGDEFVVVLRNLEHHQVEEVAEKIVHRIAEPFFLVAAQNVTIGVSIGGTRLQTCSVSSVLENADRLLYEAKRAGKGTVRLSAESIPAIVRTA